MNLPFLKYFLVYIFKSKTRQKLLSLAIFGLFISSFSLIVLQGVMGGLQKGVISRSKAIYGQGFIKVPDSFTVEDTDFLLAKLKEDNLKVSSEYEIELLIKNGDILKPIILHGLDFKVFRADYLKGKDFSGIVLGADLASSLKSFFEDQLILISPSHSDFLLTEIPRQSSIKFSDIMISDLQEVDSAHGWADIKFVQNLIRSHKINKILFYDKKSFDFAKSKYEKSLDLKFISWESQHRSLVWALKLETTVMIILFVAMSLLVAICITSGFMIFFDKIKTDLISFWVIGMSKDNVMKLLFIFTQVLSLGFILLGLFIGFGLLKAIDSKSLGFMPDIFVEQNIPISVNYADILIAFFVPYIISTLFSYYSFITFKSENSSFLKLIRSVS